MEDTNLNVRIRACWSLANLCDSLVSLQYVILLLLLNIFNLYYCRDSQVIEDIPVSIIISVCLCCLKATSENDKVKLHYCLLFFYHLFIDFPTD